MQNTTWNSCSVLFKKALKPKKTGTNRSKDGINPDSLLTGSNHGFFNVFKNKKNVKILLKPKAYW